MTIKQAMDRLVEEWAKDKSEGSYYYSWQANIAMAFYDEVNRNQVDDEFSMPLIHKIANQAAKNFLDSIMYTMVEPEYEMVPCTCSCHGDSNIIHFAACCQDGMVKIIK